MNNELINKDFISAQGQSARTSLIKKMRVNRNLENLGYPHDKFPPDKTIFNAIFNEANIYQPIEGVLSLHILIKIMNTFMFTKQ